MYVYPQWESQILKLVEVADVSPSLVSACSDFLHTQKDTAKYGIQDRHSHIPWSLALKPYEPTFQTQALALHMYIQLARYISVSQSQTKPSRPLFHEGARTKGSIQATHDTTPCYRTTNYLTRAWLVFLSTQF